MSRLRVLCAGGDVSVEWDSTKVEEGDLNAVAAVREAERLFEEQRQRGATAFRVAPNIPAERLERFDPGVDEIIVVPRVAGG